MNDLAPPPTTSPLALTPLSESGVRDFFKGLCGISDTLAMGAPARVAVAVTPGLLEALQRFCGDDPQFKIVMANVWIQDYNTIKQHSN